MRTSFQRAFALLAGAAVAVVGAGCGDGAPASPAVGNFLDGGGPGGTIVVDGASRKDARDGSAEGDAATGDAQVATNVKVTINKPAKDERQPITATFKPDVTVTVTNESKVGAPESVVAQVWDAAGKSLLATGALINDARLAMAEADVADYVYNSTPVDLKMLPSGAYVLRAVATMKDMTVASTDVTFRIDAGPTIDIRKPTEAQALKKSADIEVVVNEKLFGAVESVSMTIGKYTIPLSPPDDMGARRAHIEFEDPNMFVPPLDGEQLITVVATNSANGDKPGTTSRATRKFIVDNDGPAITDSHPVEGDLIGGIITIQAAIADKFAGVDDKSVVAVIAHGNTMMTVKLDPPAPGAMKPVYSARFDTRLLPTNVIYPHVSFRASDKLGNESSIGYLVSLDNTPPLADLDPPADFRVLKKSSGVITCSWPMDPVGPDAVDDGAVVNQVFDIRARIEDQGNSLLGGSTDFVPIATVDANSAFLFALDDTTKPLVVDTDMDGVCDAVNPLLVPTTTPMSSSDALLVNMVPLPPAGTADFTPEPNAPCMTGSDMMAPEPVCETTVDASKARYVVRQPDPNQPPTISAHSYYATQFISYAVSSLSAIWTLPPIVMNRLQCGGRQLDALGSNLSEGWVCLAVGAADALGNAQVSRVLRVCVDKDASGDCPHRTVASVSAGTPMVVTTTANHGFSTGDEVIVSQELKQTGANARWKVTVIDAKRFSLDGSAGVAALGASTGGGFVIGVKEMPDCTGTQTAKAPMPMVNNTACKPWRLYGSGEARLFQ
jgi:hypothetical protein